MSATCKCGAPANPTSKAMPKKCLRCAKRSSGKSLTEMFASSHGRYGAKSVNEFARGSR